MGRQSSQGLNGDDGGLQPKVERLARPGRGVLWRALEITDPEVWASQGSRAETSRVQHAKAERCQQRCMILK